MLYDLFGVETMDFVIEIKGDPDREVKAKAQVAFLHHVLQEALGKAEADVAGIVGILERSVSDRREKAGWADAEVGYGYGVERFYYRTGDVGYPALIDGVERRMDVLRFCGQT